jgi:hypothetical protein
MIKVYDEIVNGKRVTKYKMTEEEKAKAEERKAKLEEMRNRLRERPNA